MECCLWRRLEVKMKIAQRVRDQQKIDEQLRRALERIIQLYTDKAHFIYELLQNAEDAQATAVKFHQKGHCLEVYHDGTPFTEVNLINLCDIGVSDKSENLNQIGEFGIGFKSVFGICEKVRLYSMPRGFDNNYEAFAVEINDFTSPSDIDLESFPLPYTTKFVFPYCAGESFSGFKTIDALKKTIAKRLSNLGLSTLLFMQNLKSIEYEIECEGIAGSGCYMLDEKQVTSLCNLVTALGAKNDIEEELSYLRYSKTIPWMMDRTVDIAFPIVIEKDGKYRFQKAVDPYISVYFPTETESKIPLIVQGPYRTTPNRSSIPFDDEDNIKLAELTADLLYESVLDIKSQGQISLQLLNILPLHVPENISNWLFKPLYDRMVTLFEDEEILPTAEKGFVAKKCAILVRGQGMISLFPGDLLGELINEENNNDYAFDDDEKEDISKEEDYVSYIPYKWLPGQLTKDNNELGALYSFLTDELDTRVIRPEDLSKYFRNNSNFLQNRNDAWLEQFYKYLEKNDNLVKRSYATRNMLSIPFVKTAADRFVIPFYWNGDNLLPNVFMPTKNIVDGFNFVHSLFAQRCSSFFLQTLNLKEPDHYQYFKKLIGKLYVYSYLEVPEEEYIEYFNYALEYLNTSKYKKDMEQTLRGVLFIRCESEKDTMYANPYTTDIFFDLSNEGVSTKEYFASNDRILFVDMDFYSKNGIDRQSLKLFGVRDSLVEGIKHTGWYDSGEGNALWCDVEDFQSKLNFIEIESIISYIQKNPETVLAKKKSYIIMQLLFAVEKHLEGEIIKGKTTRNRVKAHARIIDVLTYGRGHYRQKTKWLFDERGQLVDPTEISKYDLDKNIYGEIKHNSNVYNILEFAHTQRDEIEEAYASIACALDSKLKDSILDKLLIERLGMDLLEIEKKLAFVSSYMTGAEECSSIIDQDYFDPDEKYFSVNFPSRPVKNIEYLKKSIERQYFSAPMVKYEMRERSIRVSENKEEKLAYLKDMYSCEKYRNHYICQMCKEPFLFAEIIQIEKEPKLELKQMHLLLCPNCAGYFKRIRTDCSRITKFINNLCDTEENQEEPIGVLVDGITIYFTAIHIAEIKQILRLNASVQENDGTNG